MKEKIPQCYQDYNNKKKCKSCQFAESCKFLTQDNKYQTKQNKKWLQNSNTYLQNLQKPKQIKEEVELEKVYTMDDMIIIIGNLIKLINNKKMAKILETRFNLQNPSMKKIAERMGIGYLKIGETIGRSIYQLFNFCPRIINNQRIMKLDVKQFQILKLKQQDKLTQVQIAKQLNISVGDVINYIMAYENKFRKPRFIKK